ncbi:hypothetical protein HU200_029202 [Digitaria exilis]|uniref:Methyltransferase n=1 Tax=Digitaria exilis TaxID=1010633 RepID=A0A835EPB6_9POAL|nr:hypothetical protein HU200_029202 [Digitaria exilis]CAB3489368.1 unnamed protein product [Digitaria exilis]
MALFDRNQKQRSSFCSTATFAVFVALCLFGLWMVSSPETIPGAISLSSATAKLAAVEVKEEDSSIDATNTVKKDTANVVAEDDPVKLAGDANGDDEKASSSSSSSSKDQSFDDENGRTEGGELVKPGTGSESTDGAAAAAAQAKSVAAVEEAAAAETDSKDTGGGLVDQTASTNAKDIAGGQELTAVEQASTDAKESGAAEQAAAEATDGKESGGGTPKNPTFDDENGKMEGVDLVKDDGNKTRISEESAMVEGAKLTVNPSAKAAAAAAAATTDAEEDKKQDTTGGEQQLATAEAMPNAQAELLTERAAQNGSFTTQAAESTEEKKKRAAENNNSSKNKKKGGNNNNNKNDNKNHDSDVAPPSSTWKLCNSSAGADYIPCLDNEAAIKKLKTDIHYEHRERHCPTTPPTCLVPSPPKYRDPIRWPHSRDKIWYHNVPHTMLAEYKGHQNWVKVSGEHLTFPGGGTQFKHGALRYIDLIQRALPDVVAWGRHSRVVLDVGCGVASFGGYLFDRDVLTMSLAPKDEHEAQVQFALERGIPAISAVMGTQRLPFPANVFDVVHCARCRVPWHIDGGKLLLELNRLLRPGGVFVWSATPVYQKLPEDVEIWDAMVKLTKAMCWEMLKKTKHSVVDDQVGLAIFQKPVSNSCYDKREQKDPSLCEVSDDRNAAWNIQLRACMHRVPEDESVRGSRWPEPWPERLKKAPYWLEPSQTGVYGKPAPEDFAADLEHWRKVVRSSYIGGMGIDWKTIRNVMDMRAVYGGLAAALREMKVWVMNVVTIDSPDTLPVLPVVVEVDRILRPNGKLIVRDDKETVDEIKSVVRSLQWEVRMTVSKNKEAMLCARKTTWRPTEIETR